MVPSGRVQWCSWCSWWLVHSSISFPCTYTYSSSSPSQVTWWPDWLGVKLKSFIQLNSFAFFCLLLPRHRWQNKRKKRKKWMSTSLLIKVPLVRQTLTHQYFCNFISHDGDLFFGSLTSNRSCNCAWLTLSQLKRFTLTPDVSLENLLHPLAKLWTTIEYVQWIGSREWVFSLLAHWQGR